MPPPWRLSSAPKSAIPEEIIESILKLLHKRFKPDRHALMVCRTTNQQFYRITQPLLFSNGVVTGTMEMPRAFWTFERALRRGFEGECMTELVLTGGIKSPEDRKPRGKIDVCSVQNIYRSLPQLVTLTLDAIHLWPCIHAHHNPIAPHVRSHAKPLTLVMRNLVFCWWIDEENPAESHHLSFLNSLRPSRLELLHVKWLGPTVSQPLTFNIDRFCGTESNFTILSLFMAQTALKEFQALAPYSDAVPLIHKTISNNNRSLERVVLEMAFNWLRPGM